MTSDRFQPHCPVLVNAVFVGGNALISAHRRDRTVACGHNPAF
jgi:hypothetical protein